VVDRSGVRLLGRHVLDRADHAAGGGHSGVAEKPGDAEISELHGAVAGQQEVGRFDVAVDHTPVMCVAERLASLAPDPDHLAPVEAASMLHLLVETDPVDQLHRVVELLLLLAETEQADDVRVFEFPQSFDFGGKPVPEVLVLPQAE
jgi:hypothetical protein